MPEALPLFDLAEGIAPGPAPRPSARSVSFFVPGVPQPGGSKKGFPVKTSTGKTRIAIVEDARHNATWRAVVSLAASESIQQPFEGPVVLTLDFLMPRPKNHYRTGRHAHRLKDSAPVAHASKPDRTKLMRSTEDALAGIAWRDDCQVVDGSTSKMYCDDGRPGCWIRVEEWRP